jgi:hypothetical protein
MAIFLERVTFNTEDGKEVSYEADSEVPKELLDELVVRLKGSIRYEESELSPVKEEVKIVKAEKPIKKTYKKKSKK